MTLAGFTAMLLIFSTLAHATRGTTAWPLALPITLAFGEAGFVQTWDFVAYLPGLPLPIKWLDIVFGATLVAWLMVRRLSAEEVTGGGLGIDTVVIGAWLLLVAIAVPMAWLDGGALKLGIAWVVLPYSYLPLAAAMLYGVFIRVPRSAVWRLLRALSVVVTVLGGIYVFHMLGPSLYDLAGISSTYSLSEGIRRDSLTFPVWICLTLPFLLWSEHIGVPEGVMIAVQLAAVVASVTRSLVIACVAAIVMLAFSRIVMKRGPQELLVPALLSGLGAAVVGWSATSLGARTADVLMFRFAELSGGLSSVPNLVARLRVGESVTGVLGSRSLWMGVGFSDAAIQRAQTLLGQAIVADSLWSVVLLNFGVVGAVVVAAILLVGIGTGVRTMWFHRSEPLALGAVGTAAMIWLSGRTVASSEILAFYPVVCAFALAVIAVEKRDAWSRSDTVLPLAFGRDTGSVVPAWFPHGVSGRTLAIVVGVVLEILLGRGLGK